VISIVFGHLQLSMSIEFKTLVAIEGMDDHKVFMVPHGSLIRDFLNLVRLRENEPKLAHVWYEGYELLQDEVIDDYWSDGIPFLFTISASPPPFPSPTQLVGTSEALPIEIIAVTPSGTSITLTVSPTDRVEDVKAVIQTKGKIPPSEHDLIFAAQKLEDKKTVRDYSIQKGAVLRLIARFPQRPHDNGEIPIFVKIMTGEQLSFRVKPTDRVLALKALIGDQLGIPRDEQGLIWAGRPLQDENIIQDYSITDMSVLVLRILMQ
jgi:hypothetical protein